VGIVGANPDELAAQPARRKRAETSGSNDQKALVSFSKTMNLLIGGGA